VCDLEDRYYAAAIGVRDEHLRLKFRRKRSWYLIYAAWKKDEKWHTELVRSFSGLTDHLLLPQRGKIYLIKVVRKGSRIKLYQGNRIVAQGSHSSFKKGRVTFRARGDRDYDGYLITGIKIIGTPDPKWLKEQLDKLKPSEKEPPPGRVAAKDIGDVIKEVKKKCKGVTKEDEERLRSLLEAAKSVARWWPEGYERLKKELLSAGDVEELRRIIKEAERIRDRFRRGWPGGLPGPGPGPGPVRRPRGRRHGGRH